MEYRKGIMKTSLAENLRVLMAKRLFEKITIKQICDETGVIRATFYNYFDDKYDCLNWLVHMDFLVEETEKENVPINAYFDAVFTKIDENIGFYKTAYNVIGQNAFEDMVKENLKTAITNYLHYNRDPEYLHAYSDDMIAGYYAEGMNFLVKQYIFSPNVTSIHEAKKMAKDFLSSPFNNGKGIL